MFLKRRSRLPQVLNGLLVAHSTGQTLRRGSKIFPSFVAVIKSPEGDDSKIAPLVEVSSSHTASACRP